jgi:hypothetical protein
MGALMGKDTNHGGLTSYIEPRVKSSSMLDHMFFLML